MKTDIHPKFYMDCVVTCACGNTFVTGSILPRISLDICSKCHPFFTGTQKLIDTEGRVERFAKRQAKAIVAKKEKEMRKATPAGPRTLKEMLSSTESTSRG